MVRFIEMGIAYAAAGQSYCRASAGLAERDMCAANSDGGRDAAFAEVQADAGEDFDRAAKAKAHGVIIRAFLRMFGSDCTESGRFVDSRCAEDGKTQAMRVIKCAVVGCLPAVEPSSTIILAIST